MKKTFLLKTMLLLCALIVGSSSVWGQTTIWSEDFTGATKDQAITSPTNSSYTGVTYTCTNGTGTSPGSTIVKDENLAGGSDTPKPTSVPELMIGKKGSGSGAAGGKFTAVIPLNNYEGTLTLTYYQNKQSLKVSSTTTGVSGGQTAKPEAGTQQTTTFTGITTDMTSITIVFEATTTNNVRLDNIVLTGNKASSVEAPSFTVPAGFYGSAQTVEIETNETGGTTYYTTDGTSPTNASTPYSSAITISSTTTLKAVTYNSTGTEHSAVVSATYTIAGGGVFDFVAAGGAGYNYGSGVSTTNNGSYYETTDNTWTSGDVTMVTSRVSGSGYRWWSADGTLRFYDESNATFSVPNGYVITKIVTTGANFDSSNPIGLSGSTWTGASQSVKLTATAGRNIKTITVTYTTATQTITPAKEVTTYVSTQALDFTEVDGLKAYIATSKGDNTVNMTAVEAPVPAGTALLLKKKTSSTSFEVPVAASATAPTTNYLKAGPVTFTDSETARYILKNGEFYLAGAGELAAGKAYLDLTEFVAEARQLSIVFDDEETTGISNVDITKPEVKDNVYYNLNGQRVANPSKGLFIVNGKKVIIK